MPRRNPFMRYYDFQQRIAAARDAAATCRRRGRYDPEALAEAREHDAAAARLTEEYEAWLARQAAAERRRRGSWGTVENPDAPNDLEIGLDDDELRAFEDMLWRGWARLPSGGVRKGGYTIADFPNATPNEARTAIRFREAMRQVVGNYGFRAVTAVPVEHVTNTIPKRNGKIALIYEDVSRDAEDELFSSRWHGVQDAYGTVVEPYNGWSATVFEVPRKNPRRRKK